MKTTTFAKIFSLLLVLTTLCSMLAIPALAASTTAYDILSTTYYAKTYTIASSGRTIPYTSKYLTTRGSVTNGASNGAYIDNAADELYVFDVGCTNGKYWAYVSYPTSTRRLNAYIPLSAISANNGNHAKTVSTGKFYCSKRATTANSTSYYVDKGDTVYLLSTSGSRYQIMYPVSGGKWRIAFCNASDYQRYCGSTQTMTQTNTSSYWDSKVGTTVASIKSNSAYTKWYNASGNVSAAGGYYGQCTWYAYGRFYEVHGIQLGTAPHAKYWLSQNSSNAKVRVLYGASAIRAKAIAVRTTGTYGHVMFIEHVTYNANGTPAYVYFTECNADGNGTYNAGKDCVLQKLSYSSFVSQKNPAGYIVPA